MEKKILEKKYLKSFLKEKKIKINLQRTLEKNMYKFFKNLNISNNIKNYNISSILSLKFKFIENKIKSYNSQEKLYLINRLINFYGKKLISLRKYQYLYYLNKYKFNKFFLLSKLIVKLSKIFSSKIKFNLINLKSISHNADIYTSILGLKLKKKRKPQVVRNMLTILNKAKLPKEKKTLYQDKFIYPYKNLNLISILYKNNLNKLLKTIYNIDNLNNTIKFSKFSLRKNYKKLYDTIFNSIRYKNMGGIRLAVKGRLTNRYRADRAIYKLFWKGGLKNEDSFSTENLSSVMFRGYLKSNLNYSIYKSKRRIGAFAVKGWMSGK